MGDAAYHTHARERRLKIGGVKTRLMRRPNKHHPRLPPRLRVYNRLIARRRAAVETTFATLKQRMGLGRIRYVGLANVVPTATLKSLLRATLPFGENRHGGVVAMHAAAGQDMDADQIETARSNAIAAAPPRASR